MKSFARKFLRSRSGNTSGNGSSTIRVERKNSEVINCYLSPEDNQNLSASSGTGDAVYTSTKAKGFDNTDDTKKTASTPARRPGRRDRASRSKSRNERAASGGTSTALQVTFALGEESQSARTVIPHRRGQRQEPEVIVSRLDSPANEEEKFNKKVAPMQPRERRLSQTARILRNEKKFKSIEKKFGGAPRRYEGGPGSSSFRAPPGMSTRRGGKENYGATTDESPVLLDDSLERLNTFAHRPAADFSTEALLRTYAGSEGNHAVNAKAAVKSKHEARGDENSKTLGRSEIDAYEEALEKRVRKIADRMKAKVNEFISTLVEEELRNVRREALLVRCGVEPNESSFEGVGREGSPRNGYGRVSSADSGVGEISEKRAERPFNASSSTISSFLHKAEESEKRRNAWATEERSGPNANSRPRYIR